MSFSHIRGSEWHKWDLHLHTPSSFDYKDKSQTDENIIASLKSKGVRCAAVTDHHVMDVARIKNLQKLAKKENIIILPGMEIRGDKRHKVPINIIAIFPEDSDLEHISSELLSKLDINKQRKTKKRKEDEIYVNTFDACDLIHELKGIVTVHAGNKSNSIEQCFPNALPVNVAEKLDLIEKIDVFEIATLTDIDNYRKKVFPQINKSIPMIKTADSHDAKTYGFKDDLFCWIKGDLTFDGLQQIIYEPDDRVYVGIEPPVLERIRANKTKYIDSLLVDRNDGYAGSHGEWFKDVGISFNKELIAVIGNKGSGKSAISDMIGVLGNTHNAGVKHSNLSFLNKNKFLKKGYAENFNATLAWEDGSGVGVKIPLTQEVDLDQTEKVRYLPQHYFETLTNDIEGKSFEETLKDVIFLHIPEDQRLECRTFSELIELKGSDIEMELLRLKSEIHSISEQIIKLEAKNHPSYKKQLQSSIAEKQKELSEHNKNKPKPVKDPSKSKQAGASDPQKEAKYTRLRELNTEQSAIAESIREKKQTLSAEGIQRQELVDQKNAVLRLKSQIDAYKMANKEKLAEYGLDVNKIVKATFSTQPIEAKIRNKDSLIGTLQNELRTREAIDEDSTLLGDTRAIKKAHQLSLYVKQEETQKLIDKLKGELSKPEKDFQEYREKYAKWEEKKRQIEGSPTEPNTLKFFASEKKFIDNKLKGELKQQRDNRTAKVKEIFNKKKEIVELYKTFKKSIDEEIRKDSGFTQVFNMEIDVNFKLSTRFPSNFLQFINKTKKGSFLAASEKDVEEIFSDKNLLDENDIIEALDTVIDCLEQDKRETGDQPKERQIADQVTRIQGFYDFIFSLDYLKPIYELKLDNKILDELSPGEKGTLLLVFYLMIDKEDIPLIIDQPEDNLDNKSVFQVLTRFIKNAKKRRQIIIVTHNPNLAVGADAEQIVYVELDKKDAKNKFYYEVGSIEDPKINARLVEILEGTMPAFDKRKLRYMKDSD